MNIRKLACLFLACGVASAAAAAAEKADFKKLYEPLLNRAALTHDIPADFLQAVVRAESNFNPTAVSPKGAVGLMQLMPETAARYGVRDRYDPVQNVDGGCRYLKDLMALFQRDTRKVLAAYNAGQEAVKKYGGIPPYRETITYINRITQAYTRTTIGRPRTKIFKYRDENGKLVLTNDPFVAAQYQSR